MRFYKAKINVLTEHFLGNEHSEILFNDDNRQTLVLLKSGGNGWQDDNKNELLTYLISYNIYLTKCDAEQLFVRACHTWGASALESIDVTESSFSEIYETQWQHTCFNFDRVISMFDLFEFKNMLTNEETFYENTNFKPLAKTHALKKARNTPYAQALTAEVTRIFARAKNPDTQTCFSLPVHYIVEGDNPSHYKLALETLIGALQQNHRVVTSHVYRLNANLFKKWTVNDRPTHAGAGHIESLNEKFAEAIKGSTVIVEYGRFDDDGEFGRVAYEAFTKFVDLMKPYHDTTQLIFLIPPQKPELKQRLCRRFGFPVVEICEDVKPRAQSMTSTKALTYLKKRAQRDEIVVNDMLKDMLAERLKDKSFQDLDQLYGDWRLAHLLHTAYPQYQDAARAMLKLRRHPQVSTSGLNQLDELIGLDEVKTLIKNIILRFRMNKKLEHAGLPSQPFSLHLAFMGEPGTGKTEVARLYGQILREEGLLSEGRVISVSGAAGWSVKETFDDAHGSVLFVDEAYGMLNNPTSQVAQLVALMEERRNDTVVILAGYENEMNRLLDSNPGFRSRLGFRLDFPNYTPEQLLEIFQLMVGRAQLTLPQETLSAVADVLTRGGKRDDQGNARYVRKLFEDSIGAQQVRLAQHEPKGGYTIEMLQTLLPEDVGYKPPAQNTKTARQQFEELIGLETIKKIVSERLDFAAMNKIKRDADLPAASLPMHMAFKGNPGTGKTEVARLVGKVLKEEGVLSVGDFFECGRQDLIGPFVGTTAPKIEALFRRAKGSVIFIDEAYSLNDHQRGGFGDEAITTIIDQMEKLRDDVVVIFAGYTQEIDELFEQNPGFVSRVGMQVVFPDYSEGELLKIFDLMVKRQGMYLAKGVRDKARGIITATARCKNFGNARYVRSVFEKALVAQGARLAAKRSAGTESSKRELMTLVPEDLRKEVAPTNARPQVGFVA